MGSSKRGGTKSSSTSSQLQTLHQRLRSSLSLGKSYSEDGKRKWECKDIEIQRHVLRSIAAFLDGVTQDTRHDPLVKDSVSDIIASLVEILQQKNGAIITLAAAVVVKLATVFSYSTLQPYILELIHPISSWSADHQPRVGVCCARTLNLLISNLSKTKEKEVWEILNETDTVAHLLCNITEFPRVAKAVEYIQEAASLLSVILLRWPQSRYTVWSNDRLMKFLEVISVDSNPSTRVQVLKLCSAVALCGYGAKRILDNAELLGTIISCMDSSHPLSVQMEAFKLVQCIMMHEEGCSRTMILYSESIVKAIVHAMSKKKLQGEKVFSDHLSLLVEACRLATITRWPGKHHTFFWKMGIAKALYHLLLPRLDANFPPPVFFSFAVQIPVAQQSLDENSLSLLRPYVWDILGPLAVHCDADFRPSKKEDEYYTEMLLTCACLAFDDLIRKGKQQLLDDAAILSRKEAAVRAVQMMIYSPCKYIASTTKSILSYILEPNAVGYIEYVLHMLRGKPSGYNLGTLDSLQLVIHMMCLTCYLAFPWHRGFIISKGANTMIDFLTKCLSSSYTLARQTYAFHLINTSSERVCCSTVPEEGEGKNVISFYSLWGLAALIHHSKKEDIFAPQNETVGQLLNMLMDICYDPSIGGARLFAAYILSYAGLFGFPSKLGERIGRALNDDDLVDIQLTLAGGEKLSLHRVLLMVRCPSLLPPMHQPVNGRTSNDSDETSRKVQKEFTLSSHVGRSELVKLVDYVYLGYLNAEEDMVKKLKSLAQSCGLQPLHQLLSRRFPDWGLHFPSFDLSPALSSSGQSVSDVILEAKTTNSENWTCNTCSSSVPHMHLHSVVLWASCDYLKALLRSGMSESHSRVIKAPISWGALQKLVKWFYSNELSEPPSGCLWQNMPLDEKLSHIEPLIELLSLSEFWFLEKEVKEECWRIITSRLDSDPKLSAKVIKVAASLSLGSLVEAAVDRAAGSYRQLKESGELESLDDPLVEMVRVASVRISQASSE